MGKTGCGLIANVYDKSARGRIKSYVIQLVEQQEENYHRPLVILCIGSDRYTGDALGPLIGSYLLENTQAIVYGSLDYPVHAGNLIDTIGVISQQHQHPIIVAVDACLGKNSEIGNIEVWEGGLEAGIAVGNKLPSVGHISIIGVVNVGGKMGYLDLQSTPLSIVMKLARTIGIALAEANSSLCKRCEVIACP